MGSCLVTTIIVLSCLLMISHFTPFVGDISLHYGEMKMMIDDDLDIKALAILFITGCL